jgi:hypothetical protein
MASPRTCAIASGVVDGTITMHDAQERSSAVRRQLTERFGVTHSTLERKYHPCDDNDHH